MTDLELARACAAGDEAAWEHFVLTYRPLLYKAAAAIDPAGGRELADSVYGDLFGLREREGVRQSLFRYFEGRSSLATWLRAVLAQRHVDRIRAAKRLAPLYDEIEAPARPGSIEPDSEAGRLAGLVREQLAEAAGRLEARDRLRLGLYYAQEMTLAAIGKTLGEHEATVSRHLTRTRRALREDVERALRARGLDERTIAECFAHVLEDPGALDVGALTASPGTSAPGQGKNLARDRSTAMRDEV